MYDLDEETLYDQDAAYWLRLPPVDDTPAPGAVKPSPPLPAGVPAGYVSTVEAASLCGHQPDWLRVLARSGKADKRGIQFAVCPRHVGDERAPIYWNPDTLPRKGTK